MDLLYDEGDTMTDLEKKIIELNKRIDIGEIMVLLLVLLFVLAFMAVGCKWISN